MFNQRGFMAVLTLVLLVMGAIIGGGRFPLIEGTEFTPELVLNLILQVIAPLVLLYRLFQAFLGAINARVATQAIDPGRITELFRLPEFYLAAVGTFVFVIETLTGVQLFDEQTQALIANAVLAIISALLKSWGERPPGMQVAYITAVSDYPARE